MFPAVHLYRGGKNWGMVMFERVFLPMLMAVRVGKNMGEHLHVFFGRGAFHCLPPPSFRRRFPRVGTMYPLKREHFKRTFHLNQPSFSRRSISFQGVNPLKRIVGHFVGTETSTILSFMGFGLSLEACC